MLSNSTGAPSASPTAPPNRQPVKCPVVLRLPGLSLSGSEGTNVLRILVTLPSGPGWSHGHAAPRFHLCLASDSQLSTDDHVFDPQRVLLRIIECGSIHHSMWVEDDQVRSHPPFDPPVAVKPEGVGGQSRHLAHGFFECEQSLLAHVAAQDARVCPVSARVWFAAEQAVGADVDIRLAHDFAHDVFGLAERNHSDALALGDHQVESDLARVFFPHSITPPAQPRRLREIPAEILGVIA